MSNLPEIEARARQVITAGRGAPINLLLADDAFCQLMMAQRASQGVRLPDQDPALPASARLSFLHALAAGDGVATAREACDGRQGLLMQLQKLQAMEDISIRDILIKSMTAILDNESPNSFWAAQYLLLGAERIPQMSIPLHERKTSIDASVSIVLDLMRSAPAPTITISDIDPKTDAIGFIRIGENPAHFGFPETASPKTGTNAAILHYEIDHGGGPFCLFTDLDGPIWELMDKIHDTCPLYINDPHQLMALNSYWLQEIGAFCVPCGDTQITFLDRDGVISASEYPDFSQDAVRILAALRSRGMSGPDIDVLARFLLGEEADQDDDWDLIERTAKAHPDLLGETGMSVERPLIFGISQDKLHAVALDVCGVANIEFKRVNYPPPEGGGFRIITPQQPQGDGNRLRRDAGRCREHR